MQSFIQQVHNWAYIPTHPLTDLYTLTRVALYCHIHTRLTDGTVTDVNFGVFHADNWAFYAFLSRHTQGPEGFNIKCCLYTVNQGILSDEEKHSTIRWEKMSLQQGSGSSAAPTELFAGKESQKINKILCWLQNNGKLTFGRHGLSIISITFGWCACAGHDLAKRRLLPW